MGRLGYLPDWKIISSRNPRNTKEMRVGEEDKGGEILSLMTGKNVYRKDRWSFTKRYEHCGPTGVVKQGDVERFARIVTK
jgi:hypothetical protein